MKENDLRNNLRRIWLRLGMSQQDLAALAGGSRQTIGGVESGQYAPSTTVALRLGHRRVLLQLAALGGYDTNQTGEIVVTVEPESAQPKTNAQPKTKRQNSKPEKAKYNKSKLQARIEKKLT